MAYLTEAQRYQIERDIRAGLTNARIAYMLGCSERTIEREVARCGRRGDYRATVAQESRKSCAARSAANHRLIPADLWQLIESAIGRKDSPAQVIGEHRLDASVSGIYGRLWREKKKHLLTQFLHYTASQKREGQSGGMRWVKRADSIHQRPKDTDTRDTVGHYECDSIVGKRNEPYKIVVMLDRALRHFRLGWVPDGTAAGVARHFKRWLGDQSLLPILSVTTDQGYEFAALPELMPGRLYVCDPGKPYQKGQVEHINKLIRQYIPKGKSLRGTTQAKLDWIASEINHRVRKRLGWKSPAQLLSELTTAPKGGTGTYHCCLRGAPVNDCYPRTSRTFHVAARGEPVGPHRFSIDRCEPVEPHSIWVHSAWLRLKNASLPHLRNGFSAASKPSVRHVCRAMRTHRPAFTIERDEAYIGVEVGLHLIEHRIHGHIERLAAFDAIRNFASGKRAHHIFTCARRGDCRERRRVGPATRQRRIAHAAHQFHCDASGGGCRAKMSRFIQRHRANGAARVFRMRLQERADFHRGFFVPANADGESLFFVLPIRMARGGDRVEIGMAHDAGKARGALPREHHVVGHFHHLARNKNWVLHALQARH